jgi:hypothetical protein
MGKIDEVKEILNTLRIALTIGMGIVVVIVGKLVDRFDANKVDGIFWLGIFVVIVLTGILSVIVLKLSGKTKEIKDL